jgi:hypothetical protein
LRDYLREESLARRPVSQLLSAKSTLIDSDLEQCPLKGLSHEIFGPVFWPVWMYLALNMNRLWFLNFNDAPLILDN